MNNITHEEHVFTNMYVMFDMALASEVFLKKP